MLFVIKRNLQILDMKYLYLLAIFSIFLLVPLLNAEASNHPNIFLSAENSQFDTHSSGSIVIEIFIID